MSRGGKAWTDIEVYVLCANAKTGAGMLRTFATSCCGVMHTLIFELNIPVFSALLGHMVQSDAHTLRLIFDHPYQMQVACCIHEMLQHRRWCIEHPDDVPCVTFDASVGPRFPQATRDIEEQGDDMSYIVDMMDSDTDDDQGMVIWDADKGIILPADIEDIYA